MNEYFNKNIKKVFIDYYIFNIFIKYIFIYIYKFFIYYKYYFRKIRIIMKFKINTIQFNIYIDTNILKLIKNY